MEVINPYKPITEKGMLNIISENFFSRIKINENFSGLIELLSSPEKTRNIDLNEKQI